MFWSDKESYVSFDAPQTEWLDYFNGLCQTKSVTDIVLYGDTRPIHQLAIKSAKEFEINVHIFEEGYLRPYWITYERDGANGHSRLMDITLDQIKNASSSRSSAARHLQTTGAIHVIMCFTVPSIIGL